mgnify:CR=1 FL=1
MPTNLAVFDIFPPNFFIWVVKYSFSKFSRASLSGIDKESEIENFLSEAFDEIDSLITFKICCSLWPWDKSTVLDSVEKTGRLLVAHEAVQVGGFGAEVAATVADRAFSSLRAPIKRIGAPRVPIPYAPPLEDLLRVTPERIAAVARELMG